MSDKKSKMIVEQIGRISLSGWYGTLDIDHDEGVAEIHSFDGNRYGPKELREWAKAFDRAADLIEE